MIGIGSSRIDVSSLPPGDSNGAVPATAVMSGFSQSCNGRLAGRRAEQAGVLPDVDGLRAEGDPVEGSEVAVLAGHRNLAGKSLGFERGDDAAGHAVVLGEHGLHVVVGVGEELLRRGLGDRRIPVVGVVLADDRDVAGLDGLTDDLLVAGTQEVGVGVGGVALDDDVVALGHELVDHLGLQPSDSNVVERDVQRSRDPR